MAEELVVEARSFYELPEISAIVDQRRMHEVADEIRRTGTYTHTQAELLAGAKIAWRNHARCNGRYSWRSLALIDARPARTAQEVAEQCFRHLRVSTNGGRLRAVVTVFRPAGPGRAGIRILNPQLVRYAGYDRGGHVVGDPLHVDLTLRAEAAGWVGDGGWFDVLPLLISMDGEEPQLFEVPREVVLEVPIEHPTLAWFADLGLRWHANPAISGMCLQIGGINYTAAPFSGWYVSSEIGARNLSDTNRYNQLPRIAEHMGLNTRRNAALWKDRALLELNEAVLFSYARAGVYMVDHHTAAEQFVSHVDREHALGRKVPTDWMWVNPPLSASTTQTFHRDFDPPDFALRPNFIRQDEP